MNPGTLARVAGCGAFLWAGVRLADLAALQGGPVLCPFRLATGLPCPGCGSLRAAAALLDGHPLAAIGFNAFTAIAWTGLAVWLLVRLIGLPRMRIPPPALAGFATSWLVWGIARAAVIST